MDAPFKITPRVRYPESKLTANSTSWATARTISHFIRMATIMLAAIDKPVLALPKNPDKDKDLAQNVERGKALTEASWALVDSLAWLVAIPFKDTLLNAIVPVEAQRVALQQEVSDFRVLVKATGLRLGDDPFTRPASIMSNIPAQSAAEIHAEVLLLKQGATTIGKTDDCRVVMLDVEAKISDWTAQASAALQNMFPYGGLRTFQVGMPSTYILCQGLDGANNPRVFCTMNASIWKISDLHRWFNAARNSRMEPSYAEHVVKLSSLLERNLVALTTAFNGVAAGQADNALATRWTAIAGATDVGQPYIFDHSSVQAMSYVYPWGQARTRCRRCRALFDYTVNGEPHEYVDGPWPELASCAEVIAHSECERYDLH